MVRPAFYNCNSMKFDHTTATSECCYSLYIEGFEFWRGNSCKYLLTLNLFYFITAFSNSRAGNGLYSIKLTMLSSSLMDALQLPVDV